MTILVIVSLVAAYFLFIVVLVWRMQVYICLHEKELPAPRPSFEIETWLRNSLSRGFRWCRSLVPAKWTVPVLRSKKI